MPGEEELEHSELEAVLETRRDLGPSYDRALVDSFADRVERAVAARSEEQTGALLRHERAKASAGARQLTLGIISVAAGIPITIPLSLTDHIAALIVSWAGLVGVNAAHAWQSRDSRNHDAP